MLQSSRLEYHMYTIGIDQSSFARSSFEHRCMNNIKNIYQHAGKCDDQQNLKDIIGVVIKCLLQSAHLEDHMKTIGIDQSSFARSSFEHRCMNNTKNIYQHAGKCDDQQNLKDIIDAAILSTPEGVTDNSPNVHTASRPV